MYLGPMKVLSPKYDLIFKSVFTDPETPEVLKGFIAESLGIDYDGIGNIEIGNSEIHAESEDEKFSRLDLLADVEGRKVNIEIQCTKQIDFSDRSLYYWAKTFGTQLKSGMPYGKLPEVICINIVDFKLFKEHEDYASTFEIYDTKHACPTSLRPYILSFPRPWKRKAVWKIRALMHG